MSGKSKKKVVYYGIDIGAPSKDGGFFAVRLDKNKKGIVPEDIEPDTNSKKVNKALGRWNNTLSNIVNDLIVDKYEIHIALEAPLFGIKAGEVWSPRFKNIESDIEGRKLEEYPYYTNAGGASGFIAQIFLSDLYIKLKDSLEEDYDKIEKYAKKILLYETYISGFSDSTSKKKQRAKSKKESSSDYHKIDARESLEMLINYVKKKPIDGKFQVVACSSNLTSIGYVGSFNPQNVILVSRKYANAKK